MKKSLLLAGLLAIFLFTYLHPFAQVSISNDNSPADNSAMLDVKSTNKGFVLPRMTFEQRNAIPNPIEGLMVYCSNCSSDGTGLLSMYQGGKWQNVLVGCISPSPSTSGTHIPSVTQIIWNWNSVPIAQGYKWNTTNDYGSAIEIGTSTSKTETGLNCNTNYTRYLWAYNTCGNSTATILTQTTFPNHPTAPTAGIHVPSLTQITWNWNTVTGATGYKWNNTNDYITAIDIGLNNTKTEAGLTCNSSYSRYVWSYNACGNSTVLALTQTTSFCPWSCGQSITINHAAGAIAPVSKTVSYGTVTNIPGEPTKCWTTSNLGADHQATTLNDATEASAGWYWQFNRKQGYKHDGTTRTPNTLWITSIDENLGWQMANDPCSIELGNGWRIPTSTEWINVDASGNWVDMNDAWNSSLKLHAAGGLQNSDGSLFIRGSFGFYRSSAQDGSYNCLFLDFYEGYSYVGSNLKTYGFTLRCIKN